MAEKIGKRYQLLILLIIGYILAIILIIRYQYNSITDFYYETTGENAVNMAAMAVNMIQITDEQLKELDSMSFEELLSHPCNQKLDSIFRLENREESIKYAYILRAVPEGEVKYQVEKQDVEFYGLPQGTPLDYVWLLDVIVNPDEQEVVNQTDGYYKDKNRYTRPEDSIISIYEKQKADFTLWADEWGIQIAGFMPIYTVEGTYIGLLGVDIYSDALFSYRTDILTMIVFILSVPTILLTMLYIYFHREYKKRMSDLAYRDQLTSIYNRRYFDEKGKELWEKCSQHAWCLMLVIVDIDDFKMYNDQYGHQEGDVALKKVAEVISDAIPKGQGFAARYGGEEFVCVLTGQDLEYFCARIVNEIADKKLYHNDGSVTELTISAGCRSGIPNETETLADYVLHADKALYSAKKSGKNKFCLYETDHDDI